MTILDVGVSVELHGLSAAKHNGLKGRVVSPLNEKGRWTVQLEQSENKLALKPGNLKVTPRALVPTPHCHHPPQQTPKYHYHLNHPANACKQAHTYSRQSLMQTL